MGERVRLAVEKLRWRTADGRLALLCSPSDDYSAADWLKRDGDSRLPQDVIAKTLDGGRCDRPWSRSLLRRRRFNSGG
jgi:hypothetical protein